MAALRPGGASFSYPRPPPPGSPYPLTLGLPSTTSLWVSPPLPSASVWVKCVPSTLFRQLSLGFSSLLYPLPPPLSGSLPVHPVPSTVSSVWVNCVFSTLFLQLYPAPSPLPSLLASSLPVRLCVPVLSEVFICTENVSPSPAPH